MPFFIIFFRLLEAKFAVLLASLYHWIPSRFLSAFGIGYLDIGFRSALDTEYRVSASIFGCSCDFSFAFSPVQERFSSAISWNGYFLNGRFLEMGLIIIYNNVSFRG
ncbi:unnamed protein product [Rhizophagus irregularis]|nr:unnamed protein product [Rhizophagus irregularis]